MSQFVPRAQDVEANGAEARTYATKSECMDFLYKSLLRYDAAFDETYRDGTSYTLVLNSWYNATAYMSSSCNTTFTARRGGEPAHARCVRALKWSTLQGLVVIKSDIISSTVKAATNESAWKMLYNFRHLYYPESKPGKTCPCVRYPKVQMDVESDVATNTTIVHDGPDVMAVPEHVSTSLDRFATSEGVHEFKDLTDRWVYLTKAVFSTTDTIGKEIVSFVLPEFLYSALANNPALAPFANYAYGNFDFSVRVVVPGNSTFAGFYILDVKHDSYQYKRGASGYQAGLTRRHVEMDLSTNNDVVLECPYIHHRPFIRLVNSSGASKGVRPAESCFLTLSCISPLAVGENGPTSLTGSVYIKIDRAHFAGLTTFATVQMLGVGQILAGAASGALRQILGNYERAYDIRGPARNRDKPGDTQATVAVPHVAMNFGTGKGPINVVSLRVNPYTQTNYEHISIPKNDPTNYHDLARIWGYYKLTGWNQDQQPGTILLSNVIDPSCRNHTDTDRKNRYLGEPTPLEYAMTNFQFWSGTIEFKLRFVANEGHSGEVIMTTEIHRRVPGDLPPSVCTAYTKSYPLSAGNVVEYTVPYIYDTLMRRSTAALAPYVYSKDFIDTETARGLSVAPESKTRFTVRVSTPLRCSPVVSKNVPIIVYMRAGPDFVMHGIKPASMRHYWEPSAVAPADNFPQNYPKLTHGDALNIGKINTMRTAKAIKPLTRPEIVRLGKATTRPWNDMPRVQMDSVHQDSSYVFSPGMVNTQVQTLDCHMDFKDRLRMPCLIVSKTFTHDKTDIQGFFIPLMPPNRSMIEDPLKHTTNSIFATSVQHSAHYNICNMFRMWRGSMRYTILVHDPVPISVSLIPHGGARVLGDHQLVVPNETTGGTTADVPGEGLGFVTEIMHPTVNPMVTFEVPYDTENAWTLMQEDNPGLSFSWRDKGDYNAGHIMITCRQSVTFTVWWSAGDDFQLANFYGVPYCVDDGPVNTVTDENGVTKPPALVGTIKFPGFQVEDARTNVRSIPRTQMDMITSAITTAVGGVNKKSFARMALGAIPVVGTGLVAASVANEIAPQTAKTLASCGALSDKVASIVPDIRQTTSSLDIVASRMATGIEEIQILIREAVEKVTSTMVGAINYSRIFFDLFLDIINAWVSKSWTVVGVTLIRFLSNFFDTAKLISLSAYGPLLGAHFESINSSVPTTQGGPSEASTLAGIIAGIVGTLLGVYIDPRSIGKFKMSTLERITSTSGVSYLVSILRYVQSTFELVKEYVMQALGYVSPDAYALKMLSENSEQIANFVREAQIITSEASSHLMANGRFRLRCWKTVLSAYQYQRLLCSIPSGVGNAQLAKLCTDVIKVANEKFADLSASPVRYEPYVLCIEGPPGVGKSSACEEIVVRLLRSIGYTCPSSASIYYRTAGEKFWSGYNGQPVIVYDEFLNSQDAQRCNDMIIELNKLKSTSLFIPEMAHLEEKKMRGNPLIVITLCNGAFPNITNYAKYPNAIYRRRDEVLLADRSPEYANVDLREVEPSRLDNYEHLQFRRYENVMDSQSLGPTAKTFVEVMAYLENSFQRYHATEVRNVQKRMDRILSTLSTEDAREIQLNDPFTLFYRLNTVVREDPELSQNAYTPYEELELAVHNIVNSVALAPAPQNPVAPDKMPWEIPQPQSSDFIFGAVLGTGAWNLITRYASSALLAIADYFAVSSVVKKGQCAVCLEEREIAFTCRQSAQCENPHLMCYTCWRTLTLTDNRCPTCRSVDIIPYVELETANMFYSCARLVANGIRDVSWFMAKVLDHMGTRSMELTAVVVYYLVSTITNDSSAYTRFITGHLMGVGYTYYPTHFQADFHDAQESLDAMEPKVNIPLLEEYMNACNEVPVCLHGLLSNPRVSPIIVGEMWRVPNEHTSTMVDVPMRACSDEYCYARHPQYGQFVERYMEANKRVLRTLIINYINDPNESNANMVPHLYRPVWMVAPSGSGVGPSWWEYLTGIFSKHATLIAGLVGASTVAYTIYKLLKVAESVVTPQYDDYESDRPFSTARRRFDRQRQVRYFQGQDENPTPFAVAKARIANNTFKICVQKGDNKEVVMYGVGLYNHNLLLPRHYVVELKKAMKAGLSIYGHPLHKPQLRALLALSEADIKESDYTDIALIELQPSQPLFKDIRSFIALDEDLKGPLPATAILFSVPERGSDYMTLINVDMEEYIDKHIVADQDNKYFEMKDCLSYTYSRPGACGSLLLRENSNRPILAMHVAGMGESFNGTGYGVILTRESLTPTTQMGVALDKEATEYGSITNATMVYDLDVRLDYSGSLPEGKVPYLPQSSRLVKSLVHGASGLTTDLQPAVLHKKDRRYEHDTTPLFEGVRKHGLLTIDFKSHDIASVKEALWDGWYGQLRPLVMAPKRLDVHKAITGLGLDYYKPMDLNTSMGYPYVLTNKTAKSDYIHYKRAEDLSIIGIEWIDPTFLSEISRKEKLRKNGIIPDTLYIDTLKDEKRPLRKIQSKGGTRVICNPSADYTIACRQSYLHFVAAFMCHRRNLMHAVGCNALSREWTDMLKKLVKVNTKFITIDYSNFGPGYNAGVAKAAYDIMIAWTEQNVGDVDPVELHALVYECIQSKHICHNTVYNQLGGSPSGAFFTTVVNSIVNQLYIMLAWKHLVGGDNWAQTFKEKVALIVYGDDAILTVDDKYIDKFNGVTIHAFFAEHDIVSTSAEKTATIREWVPLSEATFLKRSFTPHPSRDDCFLSPLAESSILSTTQWVWKSNSIKEATRINCEAALLQAHGHGPQYFNNLKSTINRALMKARVSPITRQWNDIDNVFFGDGINMDGMLGLWDTEHVVVSDDVTPLLM
nr:hypothetical protein [Hubei mosquito virus 1]